MNPIAPRRSTVLVIHDDPLLRAGLVAALRQHANFEVFVDDADTLNPDGRPIDVVIADYANAMRLADDIVRSAQRPSATPRILALTADAREADIRRALEAGVHGYLLLGGTLDELIEGVRTVADGGRFLSRAVAQRMADSLTRASLTSRESDVLRLVITGESNKAIARELRIEVGTVKSHMSAIMTKLGAASRTQAAGIAASRGLVQERARVPPSPFPSHLALLESRGQLARSASVDRVPARA